MNKYPNVLNKQVLDVACGGRMFWFEKNHPLVLYCDKREEQHLLCDGRFFTIQPDVISDFTKMPHADSSFNLVVFDPPHLVRGGDKSWIVKKYGRLDDNWKRTLKKGFSECWRVLRTGGTLVFKWSEVQVELKYVLSLFEQRPLFGHTTTHNLKTHWMIFYKGE